MTENYDDLKLKFNRETSKITWRELQRFYARGVVIEVDATLDLIEVAIAMHKDDKQQVSEWLNSGKVRQVNDQKAALWLAENTILWAVVVAPWVVIQMAAKIST